MKSKFDTLIEKVSGRLDIQDRKVENAMKKLELQKRENDRDSNL
jgi:hypothetical protein